MNDWSLESLRLARTLAADAGRAIVANATADGMRRSIEWVDDALFRGIAEALDERGVARKVAADMLGITPRTLRRKLASIDLVNVDEVGSTWAQIIDLLLDGPKSREQLEGRLQHIDPDWLGSILHDMVDQGWAERRDRTYVIRRTPNHMTNDELDTLVRARLHLFDSSPKIGELADRLGLSRERVVASLGRIGELGHARWHGERAEGDVKYLGMTLIARAFMRLMRRLPDHNGGVWMVEVSDWTDEERAELQARINDIERQCHELFAEYDARNVDDGENVERTDSEFLYWALSFGRGANLEDGP